MWNLWLLHRQLSILRWAPQEAKSIKFVEMKWKQMELIAVCWGQQIERVDGMKNKKCFEWNQGANGPLAAGRSQPFNSIQIKFMKLNEFDGIEWKSWWSRNGRRPASPNQASFLFIHSLNQNQKRWIDFDGEWREEIQCF